MQACGHVARKGKEKEEMSGYSETGLAGQRGRSCFEAEMEQVQAAACCLV